MVPGPSDTSGLLYTKSDDTSDEAVHGGVYTGAHPIVLTTLDPMRPGAQIRVACRGYSQLFRVADAVLKQQDGGFSLHWPALRNINVYQGGTNWMGITTSSGLKAWV